MYMLKWIRKLLKIVREYDIRVEQQKALMVELEALVRNRTNIGADVGYFKDANHVIVVGRYKNADYVQTYSIHTEDMSSMIDTLRQMERHGAVKRLDAPPIFKAVFERERTN